MSTQKGQMRWVEAMPTMRPVGRPPKNAVVNKLVLTRGSQNTHFSSSTVCAEFIFEHGSTSGIARHVMYIGESKEFSLSHYINTIFARFFGHGLNLNTTLIRSNIEPFRLATHIKMYDLLNHFIWSNIDLVDILIQRLSHLELEHYKDLSLTTNALSLDPAEDFFEPFPDMVNPLNSLPPQQATRLIECFFSIHPYSVILNKTILLQSYWTDTADPLLLSVVYGTTIYKSQMLEGKPVMLWHAGIRVNRNAFLDYAHHLLSKMSSEATLSRYQAVVMLGLFELTFGYPKRGMALFSLAYMIASKLGVYDNSIQGLNEIENEMLLMTFWAAYSCIIRGSIELVQVPRAVLNFYMENLPPVNVDASSSYRLDSASGNTPLFRSYHHLYETFYVSAIIARFSSRILKLVPVPNDLLETVMTNTSPDALDKRPEDTEVAIMRELLEFSTVIEKNRHAWSDMQYYSIHTVWLLYKIHFAFLKSAYRIQMYRSTVDYMHKFRDTIERLVAKKVPGPVPFDDFDPSNPKTLERVRRIMPSVVEAVENTQWFVVNYGKEFQLRPPPYGIMMATLETCARLLMIDYEHSFNERWRDYLEIIVELAVSRIWIEWTIIETVETKVKAFLKKHPRPPVPEASLSTTSSDSSTPENEFDILSPLLVNNLSASVLIDPSLAEMCWPPSDPFLDTLLYDQLPLIPQNNFDFLNDLVLDTEQPTEAPPSGSAQEPVLSQYLVANQAYFSQPLLLEYDPAFVFFGSNPPEQ
ncbi:hypothetical protein DFQ30_001982 [Apophysomyces sp. BC1015]|nr:hypothetical protein DFQ30_001982 [Apophysomyces sp. BC1015]